MLRKAFGGAKGHFRVEGYSSVGRASVSKTEGRGFESLCPCHAQPASDLRHLGLIAPVTDIFATLAFGIDPH